jgi:hypothetical protein
MVPSLINRVPSLCRSFCVYVAWAICAQRHYIHTLPIDRLLAGGVKQCAIYRNARMAFRLCKYFGLQETSHFLSRKC